MSVGLVVVAVCIGLCATGSVGMALSRTKAYDEVRAAIVDAEAGYGLGGKVFLSSEELRVDRMLRAMKKDELRSSDRGLPAAGMHFFDAKPLIENSSVFGALRLMPKGAILHLHNSAAVSSSWVIKNLTYRQEAKLCTVADRYYFTVRPLNNCPVSETRPIADMRRERQKDVAAFDAWLETLINMKLKPSRGGHATIDELWSDFESCFDAMKGFLQYKPFFEAYHRRLLHEFYTDNVYYIELRMSFAKVFDADGREYGAAEVAYALYHIVEDFRRQHPTFQGVKLILAKHKNMSDADLENALKLYESLSATFPGFVVGFDLVGQEDLNRSLRSFASLLLQPPISSGPPAYFFHAGELVGYFSDADENVIDAVLLDSKRIGHGYALLKHPILWHTVRRKQIVLEVCPISNQVLGLVRDLRNHPASFYVAQNLPITITSDDPGFWDAVGVSFDYYYAFMAIAPQTGLGFLKQLVWNSIRHSSLSDEERQNITATMEQQWALFVRELVGEAKAEV
ncbi:adenosine deaminase 2-like [Anopheles stephensi]|uniref:adenosine deaminase 2-like n=1 Tax=Anopheles stephensi TaxID=30069 RepID=UPI0007D13613|nr:adenosine deaminase 2-like [Anopheles stephensi]XP_035911503.1 adenosine deaminase 2-like [Anopheles stephensi]